MRRLAAIGFILVVLCLSTQPAAAHVLLTDSTDSYGAVFHVGPSDDPIAHEPATLFLEIQKRAEIRQVERVVLTIRHPEGFSSTVQTTTQGDSIVATYTFPTGGVYHLQYRIDTGSKVAIFNQSQRVSVHGIGGTSEATEHQWAEPLTISSGVALILTVIIIINRRQHILNQSRQHR